MRTWVDYIQDLSGKEKEQLLIVILNRFMEDYGSDSEIRFQKQEEPEYPDEPARKEGLYWSSCGEYLI
jgi:hypothetical protein